MEEKEIWEYIPGTEERYQVSNLGRIKRTTDNFFPNQTIDRNGYKKVFLTYRDKNNKLFQKTHLVHRIVGYVFVPGYEKGLEINHKDGNKGNNRWDNLEWVTRSQNMIHAVANGLTRYETGPKVYSFCQFDRKGNLIRKWGNINDCAYFLSMQGYGDEKIICGNIRACLKNNVKSCCGFLFSFDNVIDAESKKKELGQKAVIAVPVKGIRGNRTWDEEGEEGVIRFSYVNETEGYMMPNGKKAYATLVSKCCLGKRDTHAGYKWRFETDDKFRMNKKPKVVLQIDSVSGETIKRWEKGVTEIAQELGLANNSGISRCLWDETGHEKCLGCFWRYET